MIYAKAYEHIKNKKYFLFMKAVNNESSEFINPSGKKLILQNKMFSPDYEDGDLKEFLSLGLINEVQVQAWNQYYKNRAEEDFETMTPNQKNELFKELIGELGGK